ncbi:MAG: hypothetical protein PHH37_14060 [Paludibacter sp.]|nr:hypothetical protein [Paludibacter sp.]
MINSNEIAEAIQGLSQALSKQDADLWHSVGFWGVIISLVLGVVTLAVKQISARRKFKYDVTIQCIENFRKVFEEENALNEKNVSAYLGVIDEQLFYFRKHWIYDEFVEEWLRNMVYTLPVFYHDMEKDDYVVINGELLSKLGSFFDTEEHYRYIFRYRNIRKTILVDKKYELELIVSPNFTKSFKNMAHNDASINRIINAMKNNLIKQNKKSL